MATGWIRAKATFVDRKTREERTEEVFVEVVSMGGTKHDPDVLLQHMGGTHRVVPAHDIVKLEIS